MRVKYYKLNRLCFKAVYTNIKNTTVRGKQTLGQSFLINALLWNKVLKLMVLTG